MVNLFWVKNKRELRGDGTDLLDDSDCSDTWSLPDWSELQRARIIRDRKMRRLKRLRRRREREKAKQEALKNLKPGESHLNVQSIGSTTSLASIDEDDEIPDDLKERGQWNNSFEFLLSIISMSVGMGNFYRFPFVAYQNGGGAFLIPYIAVLTFIGRPLYLLELAVGQFCSFGPVKVWDMAPLFRGVGYGSALGSVCVLTYYSAVMGTTFYYLFEIFHATLPWAVCDPEWAGKHICDEIDNITSSKNKSRNTNHINLPELYFDNKIIGEKPTIDDGIGHPLLMQTVCLFVAWALIFAMIIRGVESSGKAAYVTTIYPFVVIFIMLIIASTQTGAGKGMLYFISPQWKKMADPNVWFAAVGQCFFSLSAGFGPIVSYSSFNPFNHNFYRDALVVSFMDTFASFIAGLTVFATIGSIAHNLEKPIDDVITGGPGLVFVTFSDAIANFQYVPQLLAFLFFTMLLTLAAGSAAAWQIAVCSVICDRYPKLKRFWVTTIMCIGGFLISMIYTTPGGQFMITLVDNFGGNVNIYIFATLECIGFAWVYGLSNLVADIEFMLNRKVGMYWKLCWGFATPVLLAAVMIYAFATGERLKYNGRPFPDVAIYCGWTLTIITLSAVPITAGLTLYRLEGTFFERLRKSAKPAATWGPRHPKDLARWKLYKQGILKLGGSEGPDTYQLPPGETPSNNNLPDWLTVMDDGSVLPKKDAEDLRNLTDKNDNNDDFVSTKSLRSKNNVQSSLR